MSRARIPRETRATVLTRAEGRCDRCGLALTMTWDMTPELHHRKLRSRGGNHDIANLLALHAGCHRWVHANPAEATRLGLMVGACEDPTDVPLMLYGARQVRVGWAYTDATEAHP